MRGTNRLILCLGRNEGAETPRHDDYVAEKGAHDAPKRRKKKKKKTLRLRSMGFCNISIQGQVEVFFGLNVNRRAWLLLT